LIIAWPLAKFVLVSLYEVFKYFIPSNDLLKRYCKSEGVTWAVVTGATDGIGLGFCEVLVQMGFNVVLVSRNNEKLQATAESLKA
jgi:17beta-estradiol 17-dehydrogenase / very-long-chain 3-oxoacyl-CoA reductase